MKKVASKRGRPRKQGVLFVQPVRVLTDADVAAIRTFFRNRPEWAGKVLLAAIAASLEEK